MQNERKKRVVVCIRYDTVLLLLLSNTHAYKTTSCVNSCLVRHLPERHFHGHFRHRCSRLRLCPVTLDPNGSLPWSGGSDDWNVKCVWLQLISIQWKAVAGFFFLSIFSKDLPVQVLRRYHTHSEKILLFSFLFCLAQNCVHLVTQRILTAEHWEKNLIFVLEIHSYFR